MTTLLFDLDGTIIDPKEGITRCIQYALEKMGVVAPGQEDLLWCIGPSLRLSLPKLLETDDREIVETGVTYYRERFREEGVYEFTPYPGAADTLAAFAEQHPVYLATAKPQPLAKRILEHMGIADLFQGIYGDDMEGTYTDKGDLLEVIKGNHRLDTGRTVMIGDRHHDIRAGQRHAMKTVGMLHGYAAEGEFDTDQPDALAEGFHDLPDHVTALVA